MASRKSCIVHYEIKNEKYSCLGNISENAYQRTLEAKTICEELGGANFHREQCLNVPDVLDPAVHAVHLNPCYKKLTLIMSTYNKSKKRKMLEDAETSRLKRSKKKNTATDLFSDVCYFCKMKRKKVKGQISYCHKLTLRQVVEKIQQVAELKEDYDVLKDIKGVDLLAKEF